MSLNSILLYVFIGIFIAIISDTEVEKIQKEYVDRIPRYQLRVTRVFVFILNSIIWPILTFLLFWIYCLKFTIIFLLETMEKNRRLCLC